MGAPAVHGTLTVDNCDSRHGRCTTYALEVLHEKYVQAFARCLLGAGDTQWGFTPRKF